MHTMESGNLSLIMDTYVCVCAWVCDRVCATLFTCMRACVCVCVCVWVRCQVLGNPTQNTHTHPTLLHAPHVAQFRSDCNTRQRSSSSVNPGPECLCVYLCVHVAGLGCGVCSCGRVYGREHIFRCVGVCVGVCVCVCKCVCVFVRVYIYDFV